VKDAKKFFGQLEVVFNESITEGMSTVLYSSSESSTTEEASSESSQSHESSSSSASSSSESSQSTETSHDKQIEEGSSETTTGGTATHHEEETKRHTEEEHEMKSMTLMEFSDVTMSSAYDNNRFPARNALNDDNTFFHTDQGVGQFWKGLFEGGVQTVTQVRIKNRGNCCGERLSGAKVFVGNNLCGKIPEIPSGRNGKWYTLECFSAMIGNSIKVVTTQNQYLHFSQIEVYGLKK